MSTFTDELAEMYSVQIRTRFRWWAALFGSSAIIFSYGMHFQPQVYEAPIFSVVHDAVPLDVWAVVWLVIGIILMTACVLRTAVLWQLGSVLGAMSAVAWLAGLSVAHWGSLHATISPTGYALWMVYAGANFLNLFAPSQFVRKGPRACG